MDRRQIEKAAAELLLEMNASGVPLDHAQQQHIRALGYGKALNVETDTGVTIKHDGRKHLWLTERQKQLAQKPKPNNAHEPDAICYYDRIPQEWKDKWADREIEVSDWMYPDIMVITPEFRKFINSHLERFDKLLAYEPFWLYVEQAQRWMRDTDDEEDYKTAREKLEFTQREFARCDANTLYAMDKYAFIREAAAERGRRDYEASTPQALFLYILDCGFSCLCGKGRQAAITSTMGPAFMFKTLLKANFQTVIAADDVDNKAQGIFEHRIKFVYRQLPRWFQAGRLANESAKMLTFDFSGTNKKGESKTTASECSIVAALATAINSKTPDIVGLDEATDMADFDKIMMEVAPTMMRLKDGLLRRVGVFIGWSTGTSSGKGKGRFEAAFKRLLEQWEKGEDTAGFIAMFLDKMCRPGMTEKILEKERLRYLSGEADGTSGMSPEESLAMYCAHYPSSPEDMFMATHRTVVPMLLIHKQLDKIADLPEHSRAVRGVFDPRFDTSVRMPEGSPFPYKVIDATWRPMPGAGAKDAPVTMFMPRYDNWANRYFQGTDPLMFDDGTSMMSSVIYDRVGFFGTLPGGCCETTTPHKHPTIPCIVNHRGAKIEEAYLQTVLMGIYYRNHGQKACKEVIEWNMGKAYKEFKCGPCVHLENTLVMRTELPDVYHIGSSVYGVDTKAATKPHLLTHLKELVYAHGHRIYIYDFWHQLRTLEVEKKADGTSRWGTMDGKRFNDDIMIASSLAYICALSCSQQPEQINMAAPRMKTVSTLERDRNGHLHRVTKQQPVVYA